ncbi:helix-turn-helix domain-containing protein [Agromyces humatus]|uniref:HTH cro/C1-type domain-containing protein n=1 Tax=Agromyces humatus TaxID=279573 RepID=A0ABN2KUW2_9MICO|nr:helix-turn-helix transcriptional regulator [Agromyces humatus]
MSYKAKIADAAALGVAIQQARLAAGITQRDLAERLGTTQRYVWELEAGKDSKAITRIFEALRETGVTVTLDVPEGPRG